MEQQKDNKNWVTRLIRIIDVTDEKTVIGKITVSGTKEFVEKTMRRADELRLKNKRPSEFHNQADGSF